MYQYPILLSSPVRSYPVVRDLYRVATYNVPPSFLSEVQQHLGVLTDEHDTQVRSLTEAAFDHLSKATGRAFVSVDLRLTMSGFPIVGCQMTPIELPYPPLVGVTTFSYYDVEDQLTMLLDGSYQIRQRNEINPAELWPARGGLWPDTVEGRVDAVTIDYSAGFPDFDDVPYDACEFVKAYVRIRYDNPDGAIHPQAIDGLRYLMAPLMGGSYADPSWTAT